jgi:hypothetical protein
MESPSIASPTAHGSGLQPRLAYPLRLMSFNSARHVADTSLVHSGKAGKTAIYAS